MLTIGAIDAVVRFNDLMRTVLAGCFVMLYLGVQKGMPLEKVKNCINDLFLYMFESRNKLCRLLCLLQEKTNQAAYCMYCQTLAASIG